jgi:hypothetical protein
MVVMCAGANTQRASSPASRPPTSWGDPAAHGIGQADPGRAPARRGRPRG